MLVYCKPSMCMCGDGASVTPTVTAATLVCVASSGSCFSTQPKKPLFSDSKLTQMGGVARHSFTEEQFLATSSSDMRANHQPACFDHLQ